VSTEPEQTYPIGTKASRARFEHLTRAFVEVSPLFQGLSTGVQQDIFDQGVSRIFPRGTKLRGITNSSAVHIILRGCVAERSPYADGAPLRFRGVGAVLGDTDIFHEDTIPATSECLDQTWTLSYPLERMRVMADADTTLMKNLSTGIAIQMRSMAKLYASYRRPATQRVARLLEELCYSCGLRYHTNEDGKEETVYYQVTGPTQHDIAEALTLSRASVENSMRDLRAAGTIHTSYRRILVTDMLRLSEVARDINLVEGS
jgi:CRP-like cAMP-binding protein